MKEKTFYSFKVESTAGLIALTVVCFILPFLWFLIPYCLNMATEFTVTNRRVRLKKLCGEWTEIPMDNVGAISRSFWFAKLIIRSASGAIAVWGFTDRDKVFELISKRMIERQEEAMGTVADELPTL